MSRMHTWAMLVLFSGTIGNVVAADWPQFRHDANRGAVSPTTLPAELHLQWVREMATPRPAFPHEIRLLYDLSYEPVVLGKAMFVPSMVTDSVTALSTETGKVLWRFFTEGPVRFAPVAWKDRVYVVSDDGHLYCVGAADGKLLWKFRGLPTGRKDRLILGNGRLISLRPARGGPVLHEGVIYFGAGIWLGDGIFVHALDAMTGKPIWSNTDSHKLAKANLDHGVQSYAGISPQGYLAVLGEKLVVPCGAQLPAFLDRKTGKLEPYTMGWGGRNGLPKGSWLVSGAGRYLVHSGDLYDVQRPNDEKFRKGLSKKDYKSLLYPGGYTRLMIDPTNLRALGAFRDSVVTGDRLYFSGSKGVTAYDLSRPRLVERSKIKDGRSDRYPDKWAGRFPQLWTQKSALKIHLKAGSRLYGGLPGAVQALEIPDTDGDPEVSWQAQIKGTPSRMIAADGKLFVVTGEGRLYAFGEKKPVRVIVHSKPDRIVKRKDDLWTKSASDALKESGTTEGYALLVGAGSGRLAEELIRQSKLFVLAFDTDGERVKQLRERFHEQGLYGERITVHQGDPLKLPLPPYLANLIVAEDLSALGKSFNSQTAHKCFRLLRPYGGTACLPAPAEERTNALNVLKKAKLPGATLRQSKDFVLLTRSGALPGAADWSHVGATAGNAGASQDRFLTAPLGILWYDGSARWHRKPGSARIRVAGGRILILSENLLALDVYTGRRLWQTKLSPGRTRGALELVALEDAIYVPSGKTCLVLDAANGKKLRDLNVPAELAKETSEGWSQLRARGDFLVGAVGPHLLCLNRHTGKLIWQYRCQHAQLSVALGEKHVYCAEIRRLGRNPKPEVIRSKPRSQAFDVKTGKITWTIADASELRYSDAHDLVVTTKGVYRAKDGSQIRTSSALFTIAGDTMISTSADRLVTYNLLTGQKKTEDLKWYRRGCTGLRACSTLATTRFNGNAAYVDLSNRKITPLWNVRSGCNNNLIPANGVLNVPNLTGGCECNYTPTSLALAPLSALTMKGAASD